MLTPMVKHILKVVFVIIVISGLLASYIFIGAPQQPTAADPASEGFRFIGPAEEPFAADPAGTPTVNGPATPPPSTQ